MKRFDILAAACMATALLAACGGGGGGGTGGGGVPPVTPTSPPSNVGANTIGFSLPDGSLGTVNTAPFGTVGGYTQSVYSQVLGFPVGTVITLKNLSASTTHTLNVLSMSAFPATPAAISTTGSGTTTLDSAFASGPVAPGGTMSITLSTAGTYYIGCAFHYNDAVSMRDVIVVGANASPGPQATPQPSGGGGNPPGCINGYC